VIDTVNDATTDTLALEGDPFQDSLLVYSVGADPRTYINPDNSTRPWVLWADDDAYINGTFPLNPPTIGVATMDGMDRTGYPYAARSAEHQRPGGSPYFGADQLVFPASDSIWLSFFHEPVGLSGDNINCRRTVCAWSSMRPAEFKWHRSGAFRGLRPAIPTCPSSRSWCPSKRRNTSSRTSNSASATMPPWAAPWTSGTLITCVWTAIAPWPIPF
jgi:hypothetical protein